MNGRPQDEEELQKREATGVIRASRFVRLYARTSQPITIETVANIHRQIFKDAWPEIAGAYRGENIKITDSKHLPPHHSKIEEAVQIAEIELAARLSKLKTLQGVLLRRGEPTEEDLVGLDEVVRTAAWLHHQITFIHPFRDGNGRTARLAANLILDRYGLVGISIKIEKENKNKYRQALAQIDQRQDYEPLMNLIYEGLIDRYEGVTLKYYDHR